MAAHQDANGQYFCDGSIVSTYGAGWALLKTAFWPLLAVTVIYAAIELPADAYDKETGIKAFGSAMSIFITGPIAMSTAWTYLLAARGAPFQVTDMFAVFRRNYWSAVAAYILAAAAVLLGLLCLIVPGIIIAIRLSFVSYLVIDRKLGPLEAVRASWEMTRGHSWNLFGLGVAALLIILLGLACLVVGVLPAMAWVYSAYAVYYLSVENNRTEPL